MGEIADHYIDRMLDNHMYPRRGRGMPHNRISREEYNRKQNAKQRGGNNVAEREVKKRFKSLPGNNGEYSIVIEQGVYRETVAVSFDKKKYRARGFLVKDEEKTSYYDANAGMKEVINMHDIFANLANLLNNLYSADLMSEDTYNAAIDGYEPFISEALEYAEIEGYLEPSTINNNKKKRIKRREK